MRARSAPSRSTARAICPTGSGAVSPSAVAISAASACASGLSGRVARGRVVVWLVLVRLVLPARPARSRLVCRGPWGVLSLGVDAPDALAIDKPAFPLARV